MLFFRSAQNYEKKNSSATYLLNKRIDTLNTERLRLRLKRLMLFFNMLAKRLEQEGCAPCLGSFLANFTLVTNFECRSQNNKDVKIFIFALSYPVADVRQPDIAYSGKAP